MCSRYAFISGILKSQEQFLLTDDDKRRIGSFANFEEIARSATETFFGPSLVEAHTTEEAIENMENQTGRFINSVLKKMGAEAVALEVSKKFFELIRIGIYGKNGRTGFYSCGLTLSHIFDEKERVFENIFFIQPLRDCAKRLAEAYETGGASQLEKLIPVEWWNLTYFLAQSGDEETRKWQLMMGESADAVAFFWCVRTGGEIDQFEEHLQKGFSMIGGYYKSLIKGKTKKAELESPGYFLDVARTVYGGNFLLRELAFKLINAKTADEAELARSNFEDELLKNKNYESASSLYVIWFVRKLMEDQRFIKENVLRTVMVHGGVQADAAA